MTKLFMARFLIIAIFLSCNCTAGVTILGSRFIIDDHTKRLKISIKNDDEGDALIKTNVYCKNKNEIIALPPLFVLAKNTANIITLIPNLVEKNNQDQLCKLSIAAIPKSPIAKNSAVFLAVRSNLHLIYRHDQLKNANFAQLTLIKKADNQFYLSNNTDFVLSLIISLAKESESYLKKTLPPGESMPASLCQTSPCNLSISVIGDDESIMKKINLSAL
ncbi:fimbria/pilus periplasmic chaperone [Orbus sturtevantii]|uniref:fimbrial biogenesis chaperone n=1 Tax=Orbus sturtevantii TaxID=3074109 RepID=UPI00370DA4D0